jgi:hypothetical protein
MSTPGGPTARDTPPPHRVIEKLVVAASEALGDGVSDLLAPFEGGGSACWLPLRTRPPVIGVRNSVPLPRGRGGCHRPRGYGSHRGR